MDLSRQAKINILDCTQIIEAVFFCSPSWLGRYISPHAFLVSSISRCKSSLSVSGLEIILLTKAMNSIATGFEVAKSFKQAVLRCLKASEIYRLGLGSRPPTLSLRDCARECHKVAKQSHDSPVTFMHRDRHAASQLTMTAFSAARGGCDMCKTKGDCLLF